MNFETLEIEVIDGAAFIWLNRPSIRNALNELVIAEVTKAVLFLQGHGSVRVIVIGGRGTAFCAGAELQWMERMAGYSTAENLEDAKRLATMLDTVARCPKPVIARLHGPAFAGGMGLAAACDLRIADDTAQFALTEVRLGLTPSTISPYIVRAIGDAQGRRYMLTGERMDAGKAAELGFVHEVCTEAALDQRIREFAGHLISGAPAALAEVKVLLETQSSPRIDAPLIDLTARVIADRRASPEAREGLRAFFEKRKPNWSLASEDGKSA